MKKINILKLVASLLLCQAAGIVGAFFTRSAIDTWYAGLNKPFFSPPNWLFAPAWLTLYLLMGVSLYLIWRQGLKIKENKKAFCLFLFHLLINALWSIIFFSLRNPFGALICIFLLWVLILVLIKKFFKIEKKSAYLLIPYWLWVSFATILNFAIWQLN